MKFFKKIEPGYYISICIHGALIGGLILAGFLPASLSSSEMGFAVEIITEDQLGLNPKGVEETGNVIDHNPDGEEGAAALPDKPAAQQEEPIPPPDKPVPQQEEFIASPEEKIKTFQEQNEPEIPEQKIKPEPEASKVETPKMEEPLPDVVPPSQPIQPSVKEVEPKSASSEENIAPDIPLAEDIFDNAPLPPALPKIVDEKPVEKKSPPEVKKPSETVLKKVPEKPKTEAKPKSHNSPSQDVLKDAANWLKAPKTGSKSVSQGRSDGVAPRVGSGGQGLTGLRSRFSVLIQRQLNGNACSPANWGSLTRPLYIRLQLRKDGSLPRRPQILSSGLNPMEQRFLNEAVQAVIDCSPLRIPVEFEPLFSSGEVNIKHQYKLQR